MRRLERPTLEEGANLNPVNFETLLAQLEEIVRLLEAGELPLDDAIDQFQQGMKLVALCREKLNAAEQKVELVLASAGGISTRPFEVEE